MEATKRDITLVKKGHKYVLIDENDKQSRSLLLIDVAGSNFNLKESCAKEFSTDMEQKHIRQVFAETLGGKPKILIKMHLTRKEERYKVSIEMCFSPVVIEKLNMILIDPKLRIHGEFIISYRIGNETSPFLNPGYKFSVSASLLKDQCFENFNGSSYINNLMNGDYTITDIHIYHSVSLEWKTGLEWKGEKMNVLEKLWNDKMLMDCVIVASNQAEIMCHRSILAAHSDVLFAMLTCGLQESQTNRIRMEETSEQGINILVKYFYKNDVDDKEISFEVALELLQMAHKYNISKLEVIMLNILFRKPEEWFTLDNVVDLYVDTKQVADVISGNDSYCYGLLRDRMLHIIKRHGSNPLTENKYKKYMKSCSQLAALDIKLPENMDP